ncbi:hypothetical protein Ciccas_008752 [Cichlidogyrus casuarinus]|uniref:Uncharacterized protein n=1 Tax=Cichlidogyrus casuarinus TaxID=1844966 RepID=A0ABD2PZL0_9PLAT
MNEEEENEAVRCDLERMVKKLENRIADQSNIIMLTKKRADFEMERSSTVSRLNDRLVKENGHLKKALRVSKSDLLVAKKEVDSLKRSMDILQLIDQGPAEKHEQIKIELLIGLREELESARLTLSRMVNEHQQWCAAMKPMINHFGKVADPIIEKNASLKTKLASIQDDTCNQVDQYRAQVNRAVDEKNEAMTKLAVCERQISAIKSQFDANAEVNKLRVQLDEAKEQYRILRGDFDVFKEFSRQQLTLEQEQNQQMRRLFN